jgi:hypothetical protein
MHYNSPFESPDHPPLSSQHSVKAPLETQSLIHYAMPVRLAVDGRKMDQLSVYLFKQRISQSMKLAHLKSQWRSQSQNRSKSP